MSIKIPFFTSQFSNSGIAEPEINIDNTGVNAVDGEKILKHSRYYQDGIRNSFLFQKCSHFYWPYWLEYTIDRAGGGLSLFLHNEGCRSWMRLTNLISSHPALIDPAGMVAAGFASWAVEFWLADDEGIMRPSGRNENVVTWMDTGNWSAAATWKCRKNTLNLEYFVTRTSIDELIIQPECSSAKTSGNLFLLMVIRPYTHTSIGGTRKMEYKTGSDIISINGRDCICMQGSPDMVETGNAVDGDIFIERGNVDRFKVNCDDGMATMAVGYKIDKKGPLPPVRIALSPSASIKKGKIDIKDMRSDYSQYTAMRLSQGIQVSVPGSRRVENVTASKIGVLQSIIPSSDLDNEYFRNIANWKNFFFSVYSLNRMGYFNEALMMLRSFASHYTEGKVKDMSDATILAYLLSAISDHYLHSRNADFLQEYYPIVKKLCTTLHEYTGNLKAKKRKKFFQYSNTHPYYFLRGLTGYDISLLAYAFSQGAFLARSMGIFGDENRYIEESLRLGEIFSTLLDPVELTGDHDSEDMEKDPVNENETKGDKPVTRRVRDHERYHVSGVFPFTLGAFGREWLGNCMSALKTRFGSSMHFSPLIPGTDMVVSLMYANAMLYTNDPDAIVLIEQVEKIFGNTFSIPEYVNPSDNTGVHGEGASTQAVSILFQFYRNLLFIDLPERLEIFPVPVKEWFLSGKEVKIENAPSRFGTISFRMVATRGEVKIEFLQLPQFVPPEIMIRLPFKAKIVQEDDFVIKKEMGNAFLLNGWPDSIRFRR